MRCAGQVVVPHRSVPHVCDWFDWRVDYISARADREAGARKCARVLLTTRGRRHSRSLTASDKEVSHGIVLAAGPGINHSHRTRHDDRITSGRCRGAIQSGFVLSFQPGIRIGQIPSRLVASPLWHLGDHAQNDSWQRRRYMIRAPNVIRERCGSTARRTISLLRKVQGHRARFPDQNIQQSEIGN